MRSCALGSLCSLRLLSRRDGPPRALPTVRHPIFGHFGLGASTCSRSWVFWRVFTHGVPPLGVVLIRPWPVWLRPSGANPDGSHKVFVLFVLRTGQHVVPSNFLGWPEYSHILSNWLHATPGWQTAGLFRSVHLHQLMPNLLHERKAQSLSNFRNNDAYSFGAPWHCCRLMVAPLGWNLSMTLCFDLPG